MTRQQYIHLSWQGYLDGGLRIVAPKDKGKGLSKTIGINTFETVKKHVLDHAQRLRNQSIKELEKQYNQAIQIQADYLRKMIANANDIDKQDFFKAVLESAHVQEKAAASLIDQVSLNASKDLFDYSGGLKYTSTHGGFHVPNASEFTKGSAKWHYVRTLQSAFGELLQNLTQPDSAPEEIKTLPEYIKIIKIIKGQIKLLSEFGKNAQYQENIIKKLGIKHNTGDQRKRSGGVIPHETAKAMVGFIEKKLVDINSISEFTRFINQNWAEIEGALIAMHGNQLAQMALSDMTKMLGSTKSVGSNTSRVKIVNGKYVITTDSLTQKEKDYWKTRMPQHSSILLNQGKAKLDIFRDYSVQNKADIIFDFKNLNNQTEAANISMKYTNLYSKYNTPEFDFPTIELQDSFLLLYLAGIETFGANMKNADIHYLNVLAHHDDAKGNNIYNETRKSANESLLLLMLYQALTGNAQNREGGTNANILAVKDPKTGYVRFFDMYEIINAAGIGNIEQNIGTYPKISMVSLKNNYEVARDNENNPNRAAALRRSQKVVLEARDQNIRIAIAKKLLQKVYQKPDIT